MYSYQSLIVPIYAKAACRSCAAVACCAAVDPVFRPCWPVFTRLLPYDEKSRDRRCVRIGGAILSQTLSNKDRQCREARSSCSVCCGWYEWWRLLSRSTVLFATLWHCRELSDERYAHHISKVRVLIATTTDAGCHRPFAARFTTPAIRSVDVVYYAVVSTRLLLSACC